jgi:hypothetical protein
MDLVGRLCDGGRKLGEKATQAQLLAIQELMQLLSAGTVCKTQAVAMRNGGAPSALTAIIFKQGGAPDQTRMEATQIATCLAQHDFPSAELLYRAGIVKVVASEPDNGLLLNALLVVIRGLTSGCREKLYEELFASGAVPKICNSLESPELNEGDHLDLPLTTPALEHGLLSATFDITPHLPPSKITLTPKPL